MGIAAFDHIAVSTSDGGALLDFYRRLGFGLFDEEAWAAGTSDKFSIVCGDNKINVRVTTDPAETRTGVHLAVVWEGGLDVLLGHLADVGIEPALGPVPRLGGRAGATRGASVYLRDPDRNILEFISYDPLDLANCPGPLPEEEYAAAHRAVHLP